MIGDLRRSVRPSIARTGKNINRLCDTKSFRAFTRMSIISQFRMGVIRNDEQ